MSDIERIYNRHIDALLSYGIGLGFPRELIKDAIQDIFYKLSLKQKELEKVDNIKHYLFRMLKNRLLDLSKSTIQNKRKTPNISLSQKPRGLSLNSSSKGIYSRPRYSLVSVLTLILSPSFTNMGTCRE